ncbi:MAG: hypothetical protein K0S08_128 [Gammaproteobacteria bacterium]|jgi:hypothetical protein|nr:hypothetical protein [Gammaproteobacteria bacterium]MCE3239422.1 hypothetical protein [Gammaproteobacteria bacterium]
MYTEPPLCPRLKAILLGIGFSLVFNLNHIAIFGLLFFLPALWLTFQDRISASLFIFFVYLGFSWAIIPAILNYYGWEWGFVPLAFFSWFIAGILPSIPWLFCYPTRNASVFKVAILITILIIILSIPPFGVLIWGDPISASGLFFPGLKYTGIVLGYILILALGLWTRFPIYQKKISWMILILVLLSIANNIIFTCRHKIIPPRDWIALNTNPWHTGPRDLSKLILENVQQGKSVIILPENITDVMTILKNTRWQHTRIILAQHQAVVIMGAVKFNVQAPEDKHQEGIAILKDNTVQFFDDRQPLPIISWRPFVANDVSAFWAKSGVYRIDNQQLGVFVCFEDFLPWLYLTTLAAHPSLMISIANHWWDIPIAIHKQTFSFLIWARLAGIPTLISDNSQPNANV